MRASAAALLLALSSCWSMPCPAFDRVLPVVIEAVDEICVIETPEREYRRVVFLRADGVVIASINEQHDMQLSVVDGRFQLVWQDYFTAERIVLARRVSYRVEETDPFDAGQNGPWWCMFRNMRGLRQP